MNIKNLILFFVFGLFLVSCNSNDSNDQVNNLSAEEAFTTLAGSKIPANEIQALLKVQTFQDMFQLIDNDPSVELVALPTRLGTRTAINIPDNYFSEDPVLTEKLGENKGIYVAIGKKVYTQKVAKILVVRDVSLMTLRHEWFHHLVAKHSGDILSYYSYIHKKQMSNGDIAGEFNEQIIEKLDALSRNEELNGGLTEEEFTEFYFLNIQRSILFCLFNLFSHISEIEDYFFFLQYRHNYEVTKFELVEIKFALNDYFKKIDESIERIKEFVQEMQQELKTHLGKETLPQYIQAYLDAWNKQNEVYEEQRIIVQNEIKKLENENTLVFVKIYSHEISLFADLNLDGAVNLTDRSILENLVTDPDMTVDEYINNTADLDGDHVITQNDLVWMDHLLEVMPLDEFSSFQQLLAALAKERGYEIDFTSLHTNTNINRGFSTIKRCAYIALYLVLKDERSKNKDIQFIRFTEDEYQYSQSEKQIFIKPAWISEIEDLSDFFFALPEKSD
ncbi:MAG: hypothetical protein HYW47_01940 [Deltaproteobacteria bacterium]|nr:hypothetical protein [Deltaproteobacteria bacterium]